MNLIMRVCGGRFTGIVSSPCVDGVAIWDGKGGDNSGPDKTRQHRLSLARSAPRPMAPRAQALQCGDAIWATGPAAQPAFRKDYAMAAAL